MRNAATWFDGLNDLQTVSVLMALLLSMATAATFLLVASVAALPQPGQAEAAQPAVAQVVAAVPAPSAGPPPDLVSAAQMRTVTVAADVNLRAEPTTAAQALTTLPRHTELELLGDDEMTGATIWRHVRTDEGREGWVIGSALVL